MDETPLTPAQRRRVRKIVDLVGDMLKELGLDVGVHVLLSTQVSFMCRPFGISTEAAEQITEELHEHFRMLVREASGLNRRN